MRVRHSVPLRSRAPGSVCWFLATLLAAQSPEEYFRGAGIGYRQTSEEQRRFWQPHIASSHQRILEAAGLVERRDVVTVLGARNCTEIPLDELARRFERVVLADLDGPSLLEAIQALPLELRPKVELHVSDVTSFVAPLMANLERAAEEAATAGEALDAFGRIFAGLPAGHIPPRLPASDLVVSSLVLSALDRYPLAYADRLLQTRFGQRLRTWGGLEAAGSRLRRVAIEDHVGLLRTLCRPGGAVYFADTLARGPAYAQFPATVRGEVESAAGREMVRLGLDGGAAMLPRLCQSKYGTEREIAAFEALLAAYERAGPHTFETMVAMAEVEPAWKRHGLAVPGGPVSWWWIEYPCAIIHSPGGFRVTSWILRPLPAE